MKTFLAALTLFVALLPCFAHADQEMDLQWSVCDKSPGAVLQKLGDSMTRAPDKKAPITYYDTDPPTYVQDGIMFRTKLRKGALNSAVKVRFDAETSNIPDSVSCVWDRYGSKETFTCEREDPVDPRSNSLWSENQVQFAGHYETIAWNRLVGFGPYINPKWKMRISGHKAVFDDVTWNSIHFMEFEVKTPKSGSDSVYQQMDQYLRSRGVVLCQRQESKTLRIFRAMGLLPSN